MNKRIDQWADYLAHSFICLIKKNEDTTKNILQNVELSPALTKYSINSNDNSIELAFNQRSGLAGKREIKLEHDKDRVLYLGSTYEKGENNSIEYMANCSVVEFKVRQNELHITSSIVGLPPIFVYDTASRLIVTSDLHLLTKITDIQLYFDSTGVIDAGKFGYPIECHTLFKNCSMLPGGQKISINAKGEIHTLNSWEMPDDNPLVEWDSFCSRQIQIFKEAVRKIDLSKSFISLTAGLDTRAILAVLIEDGRNIPTFTISDPSISLDARTAQKLSKVYELEHNIVAINDAFFKSILDYSIEASRLSGGLSSLTQATEVYYYGQVAKGFSSRLSGNLGNQVGRRGTENIRMRNADISILNGDYFVSEKNRYAVHWFKNKEIIGGTLDHKALLQKEVPYSSVGNYCIGNNYAIQQTPYANRQLIENLAREPNSLEAEQETSLIKMRLKDLKHRFLGDEQYYSFQRKLISDINGFVATYPINWGWRAKGGVSYFGIMLGVGALIDAYAYSKGLDNGIVKAGLKAVNIYGLHEFSRPNVWLKNYMKEYVCDTFASKFVQQSGLFNNNEISKLIKEYYKSNNMQSTTIIYALDLVIAQNVFKVKI